MCLRSIILCDLVDCCFCSIFHFCMSRSESKSGVPASLNLLDFIPDGVFSVDVGWNVTFFNRAAEQITGIPRHQALGRRCCDVFRASICESQCALRQTMATRRPVANKVVYIIDSRGQKARISISTAVLKDAEGNVVGGVETFRDLRVVEALRREMEHQEAFVNIIGHSAPLRRIFETLPAVAQSESAVFIAGASGTGKELFARAIHALSRRGKKPFVAVNCGALPDSLLESELFGYKAGAFTDARRDKPGRFALAEGGHVVFWMRLAIFLPPCRRGFCACCRSGFMNRWEASLLSRRMCA
jgi:PAS domain S-box-containing protein